MNGDQRFHVKRAAGMSAVRADGTLFDPQTDAVADDVETWVAAQLGGLRSDTVSISGDSGYDCAVRLGCVTLRVDAVHAGFRSDGTPRGRECHLIVNCDSPKLYRSDVLVLVTGPPFAFLGGVPTTRFLAQAVLQNFGYGAKFALPASSLVNVASLFRMEARAAWHATTD